MIFSIIIVVAVLLSFRSGYHKGAVMEVLSLGGYLVAVGGAFLATPYVVNVLVQLLSFLGSISKDYKGILYVISFFLLFALILYLVKYIIKALSDVANLPVLKQLNSIIGGLLSAIICILLIWLALNGLEKVPNDWIQQQISTSDVSKFILQTTPQIFNNFAK